MAEKWQDARNWIRADIARRALREGDRLPTEPEIQRATGLGRHSVRRAVAELAAEGVVSIQQGRGTFLRARPDLVYRISGRTRFHENLRSQGLTPATELLQAECVSAPDLVAQALKLVPGAEVHRLLVRGLGDGQVLTVTRSFHSCARFPDLARMRAEGISLSAIYGHYGLGNYRRSCTTLYARLPLKSEARLLEQPAEQPVMVLCKTDMDDAGSPIGYSEAIWAGGRVRFAVGEAG